MDSIHPHLVRIALDSVPSSKFESFGQEFFGALRGQTFIPLGGVHDKGADGYVDVKDHIAGKVSEFVLMSVQEDARAKIRFDVKRLREVGREPKSVIYLTSRVVKHIDLVEKELSDELKLTVRIRDGKFIASEINTNNASRASFEHHLRGEVAFLRHVGRAPLLTKSKYVDSPEVYVFLHQELDRDDSQTSLVDAVLDALILWSLEGTDPDQGIFMTREAVIAKIEEIIPSAVTFMHPSKVNDRLQTLSGKKHPEGRSVRWYKKDNQYCLPFETRSRIEQENFEDAALLVEVQDGFLARLDEKHGGVLTPTELAQAGTYCLEAIRRSFEKEGLSFARFLAQEPDSEPPGTIVDAIDEVLNESGVPADRLAIVGDAVFSALRGAFYSSTECERLYLSKLSRTFALFFTLRTEPSLMEYFQDMAADFYLYVGSDIIVRALSERYLPEQDQMTRNMLKMIREMGGKLILAGPVLEEVVHHLRTSDLEFKHHFQDIEPYLKDATIPQQSEKILVRAYFYAHFDPEKHDGKAASWAGYIQQFCEYGGLHKPEGIEDLKNYLVNQFDLTYESRDELEAMVDLEVLEKLTEGFKSIKKHEALARNDATMTLAVYARRKANGESGTSSEFGYRTWWLTDEGRILAAASEVLNETARFAMRPEFLLNFISLSPRAADVRKAYRNIFPSVQGIRLGKRLAHSAFDKLMSQTNKAMELEPGRRKAELSRLSDRIKGDWSKKYPHSFADPTKQSD